MNIFVILLLSLDLRAWAFNYPQVLTENPQGVEIEILSDLNADKCSRVQQPLCATNGKDFLYFQNKCVMEVKNYQFMTQGLTEYNECPSIYCQSDCPDCVFINEPVCAAEVLTGERQTFQSPCEVERKMCTTKRVWTIVKIEECVMDILNRILRPLQHILQNAHCPTFCPQVYRPVCARFMDLEREFANECELRAMSCQSQQAWYIIAQGPCQSSNSKEGQNDQQIKEDHCQETHKTPRYSQCPEFCQHEHKPVCARFGEEHKEFANLCELQKAKCETNINWEIHNLGACLKPSKCPQTCDRSYKPVCAKFKWELKEFSNACELEKAICETDTDWKLIKEGHCPSDTAFKPVCRKMCPKQEYNPVCASYNGQLREFANSCELDKESCMTNTAWELVKWGSCPACSLNTFPNSSTCPQLCSRKYNPVCAKFQSTIREFDNKCEMEKTICETKANWLLLKSGRCPLISNTVGPCSSVCSQEFSPVCASLNGELREFFNSCELDKIICKTNTEWEVLNEGPCFDSQFKSSVEYSCENDIKQPLCAMYEYKRKTFDSSCQLAKEIERSGNTWSILHTGPCGDAATLSVDNTKEKRSFDSVSKTLTATNFVNNLNTMAATTANKTAKEHESIFKNFKKATVNFEEEDAISIGSSEEHNYGVNSTEDSSSSSSSSEEDETYRHWEKAQTLHLHSDENQSLESNTESLQVSGTTLDYKEYATEADASEKPYSAENHTANTPPCKINMESMLISPVKNCSATNSHEHKAKIAEEEQAEHALKPQAVIRPLETNLGEEKLQVNYRRHVLKSDSDKKPANSREACEAKNPGECQPSPDHTNAASITEMPHNPKANLTFNTNNMPDKTQEADVNERSAKNGVTYNGLVFKAPVYDAPTYNFIFIGPVTPPGFDLQHALPQPTMPGLTPNTPFHTLDHFTSLAAHMRVKDFAKANVKPSSPPTNTDALKQNLNYEHPKEQNS